MANFVCCLVQAELAKTKPLAATEEFLSGAIEYQTYVHHVDTNTAAHYFIFCCVNTLQFAPTFYWICQTCCGGALFQQQ